MTTWDPPDTRTFEPFAPTSALLIGPHNRFLRQGLVLNDRSSLDCYWINELTGFDSADISISEQPNVQEDGATPDPGFHGGRTMTMTGYIQAGSYPKMLAMGRALLDSVLDLVESPMTIYAVGDVIIMPTVTINCRLADKVAIDTKIQQDDITGVFKRNFTMALRATSPVFKSIETKTVSIAPESVADLGRFYPRTYDLTYPTLMDSRGNTAANLNMLSVINEGNWDAQPIIRFTGPMSGIELINFTGTQSMRLIGAIAAGDYIEINTETGTIRDSLGQNQSAMWDTTSDWIVLKGTRPGLDGNNTLQLNVDSFDTGAMLTVTFSDTFL